MSDHIKNTNLYQPVNWQKSISTQALSDLTDAVWAVGCGIPVWMVEPFHGEIVYKPAHMWNENRASQGYQTGQGETLSLWYQTGQGETLSLWYDQCMSFAYLHSLLSRQATHTIIEVLLIVTGNIPLLIKKQDLACHDIVVSNTLWYEDVVKLVCYLTDMRE